MAPALRGTRFATVVAAFALLAVTGMSGASLLHGLGKDDFCIAGLSQHDAASHGVRRAGAARLAALRHLSRGNRSADSDRPSFTLTPPDFRSGGEVPRDRTGTAVIAGCLRAPPTD
jgi:hypothetical protein